MIRKLAHTTIILMVAACLLGCQEDVWNDHYSADESNYTNITLMEALRNDGRFATFVDILQRTGGDSLLSDPCTYTVFAPVGQALEGVVVDSMTMTRIVKNHVSRYLYGPSDLADTLTMRIKMLNGKYQELRKPFTINGQPLTDVIRTANGIIWPIDKQVDYYDNLWELLQHGTERYDSIYSYLKSFNDTLTTPSSIMVGENEKGQKLYFHNKWMKKYGSIHLEDSLYTALLPTNGGWQEAYRTISPYFRTFGRLEQDKTASGSIVYRRTYSTGDALCDSLQDAHTREMIVHDMLFRRRPDFQAPPGDSLITTSGNVYHHPSYLIQGLTQQTASNGLYYDMNGMPAKVEDSFLKPIRIEAENASGRAMNYATITQRSAADSHIKDQVSDLKFIEVVNTSTNNLMQPQVVFDIPDVLAARYDIYAVFVPALAFDTLAIGYQKPDTIVCQRDTIVGRVNYKAGDEIVIRYPYYDADSTKVCFYMNYVHETPNASGYNMFEDGKIEKDPVTGEFFVTKGYEVTTFLVARAFQFPYANYISSAFAADYKQTTNTKIRVVTNLTNADKKTMGYTMRLDCLLLIPSTEDL